MNWWLIGAGVWTLLTVLSASQIALDQLYNGEQVRWGRILALRFADWYTCALFIPGYVWLTHRYPIKRPHLSSRFALYIAVTVAAVIGKYITFVPVRHALIGRADSSLSGMLAGNAVTEFTIFAAVVAALHGVQYYQRYQERESHAAQLQAKLSDAQLRALRAQLNPHFLFNSINAIAALIHRDPDAADTMLTRLAGLLQLTLRSDPRHELTLAEEMAMLEHYIDIMRLRFGERLEIETSIPESLRFAMMPAFMLQPLFENAFEHGVARVRGVGRISFAAESNSARLILTVSDNGPGPGDPASSSDGIGLENTRKRLAELYGSNQRVVVTRNANGGCTTRLELPLRLQAELSLA